MSEPTITPEDVRIEFGAYCQPFVRRLPMNVEGGPVVEQRLAVEVLRLRTALTLATQRAEAAEAERDALAEKWGGLVDDHGDPLDASGILEYVCIIREELSHMTAERDALRKDAAAVIAAAKAYVDFMYGFREETDAVPFVDGLQEAVTTLRAQEGE